MISKWKYNYTDEEKNMALTIQNRKQEIEKLIDELEEQERHIKEANAEIERLNNIIKEVREYIYNKEINTLHFNSKDFLDTSIATELLEILDKGSVKAIPPEVIGTNGEDGGLLDYGDR